MRVLVAIGLCCAGIVHAGAQSPMTDDAAIKDVVRRYVDAREKRDANLLAALFTADADQLTTAGEWRQGRDNVVKGGLASSEANPGSRQITIERVRFVAPDLALADGRYEIAGAAGGPPRRMRTSFVMVRSADASEWRIAAIRNMTPADPAPKPPATADASVVLAPVNALFAAFEAGDAAAMLRHVYPDGRVTASGLRGDGASNLRQQTWTQFAERVKPERAFQERIADPEISIDGDIAVVWAPFVVRIGGKVSNCGVDHFDLVREAGAWKVMNLTFSSRTTGCPAQ
jgi:uncharacterized protein (TIGR02246 family)